MNSLSAEDVARFELFLSSVSNAESLEPAALVRTLSEHRELCDRVLAAVRTPSEAPPSSLTAGDFTFLEGWLKARELILTGLQFLEMADESTADSVRHERECTETAFDLLPEVIRQARGVQVKSS